MTLTESMTLTEILAEAKRRCVVGTPMLELPGDELRIDDRGRVFIDLETLLRTLVEKNAS